MSEGNGFWRWFFWVQEAPSDGLSWWIRLLAQLAFAAAILQLGLGIARLVEKWRGK